MSKVIHVRHVPDKLHRRLKRRATVEGLSLSDYLIREMSKLADRPTTSELRARIAERAAVALKMMPADKVRSERDRD